MLCLRCNALPLDVRACCMEGAGQCAADRRCATRARETDALERGAAPGAAQRAAPTRCQNLAPYSH
eukprot:6728522-Prymnesium_polylepis.1